MDLKSTNFLYMPPTIPREKGYGRGTFIFPGAFAFLFREVSNLGRWFSWVWGYPQILGES